MMYPYMTLNDNTEITHSEMKDDGSVKVYIETPDQNGGLHSAVCWLPQHGGKKSMDIRTLKWSIIRS